MTMCVTRHRVVRVVLIAGALLGYSLLKFNGPDPYYATHYETATLDSFISRIQCRKVDTLPPGWCMDDDDQIPRFWGRDVMPDHAKSDNSSSNAASLELRHYTHDGYEKCLANKTIVFAGDSRVRYQFMNLVAFLKHKKFMKCEDQHASYLDNKDCLLINEKTPVDGKRLSWTEWFETSTNMLRHNENNESTTGEQQDSLCDCFRPPSHLAHNHFFENRFIKRHTRFGEINMIFLQNFVNQVSMNEDFPPYSSFDNGTQKRCKPGGCGRWAKGDSVNAWVGDLNATIWEILPKLNATHAFVNLGWTHMFNFAAESEFSCTMAEYTERHNQSSDIKLSYLTHVPFAKHIHNPSVTFDATKLKCNVDVLDRTIMHEEVPLTWYWDGLHVLSILNEEYNHQLIKKICPMGTQ